METTFEKIVRKTGMKPVSCKCNLCKKQCQAPCFGTPEDMIKIIGDGYKDRVVALEFKGTKVLAPKYDNEKKSCTFFTNGLCELHDSGLKPTVGKLSHHSTDASNFNPKKSIHHFVMKEWEQVTKEEMAELIKKYIK